MAEEAVEEEGEVLGGEVGERNANDGSLCCAGVCISELNSLETGGYWRGVDGDGGAFVFFSSRPLGGRW